MTCLSSSLSGVRAAATAGLAITPLPKHAFTVGLRPLGKKEALPPLPPPVEYFLQVRQADTRDSLAAFVSVIQNKADRATLAGPKRKRKDGSGEGTVNLYAYVVEIDFLTNDITAVL